MATTKQSKPAAKKSYKIFVRKGEHTVSDILEFDADGADLFWVNGREFLALKAEDVKKLSALNKARYLTFKEAQDEGVGQARSEEEMLMDLITSSPNYEGATERLAVKGGDPDFEYRYVRPDQIAKGHWNGTGLKIATDPSLETFENAGGGSPHVISSMGEPELVLVKIPKEGIAKRQAEKVRKQLEHEGEPEAVVRAKAAKVGVPFKKDAHKDVRVKLEDIPSEADDD